MTELSGRSAVPCAGLVCHIGAITGAGCSGNAPCPLKMLAERGVIEFPPVAATQTFEELVRSLNCTREERAALVWHLAALRLRKTVERFSDPASVLRA